MVQAVSRPEFRTEPRDIDRFYVRTGGGDMVPLGTLSTVTATSGPDVIYRYNRNRAVQLIGSPAAGYSSGQAVQAMEEVAASSLPAGFSYEWTGTTYQEKEAQGHEASSSVSPRCWFFCFWPPCTRAGRYRSLSCWRCARLFGALFAVWIRGYSYDIYTQIGIVTLIGLAAKNAILIVEFARTRYEAGHSIREAALEAARSPAAAHSDDIVRLHPGRDAAADGARSWRGFAALAGHGGLRRHERGHLAGHLYRAGAVRGDSGNRRAQTQAGHRAGGGGPMRAAKLVGRTPWSARVPLDRFPVERSSTSHLATSRPGAGCGPGGPPTSLLWHAGGISLRLHRGSQLQTAFGDSAPPIPRRVGRLARRRWPTPSGRTCSPTKL